MAALSSSSLIWVWVLEREELNLWSQFGLCSLINTVCYLDVSKCFLKGLYLLLRQSSVPDSSNKWFVEHSGTGTGLSLEHSVKHFSVLLSPLTSAPGFIRRIIFFEGKRLFLSHRWSRLPYSKMVLKNCSLYKMLIFFPFPRCNSQ